MTNSSKAQDAKLTSLLSLENEPHKTSESRQQGIMQGVRWLVTLQALVSLYLTVLPGVFINILSTVVKPDKDPKNGN